MDITRPTQSDSGNAVTSFPHIDSPKSPTLACCLSIVCVGAGQLYVDHPRKALLLFGAAVMCGLLFGAVGLALVIPLIIYGAYDAYQLAIRHNETCLAIRTAAREQAQAQEKLEASTVSAQEFVERIQKAHLLFKNELLNQDEFTQRKAQTIALLESKSPREDVDDFLTTLLPLIKTGALSVEEIRKIKALVF